MGGRWNWKNYYKEKRRNGLLWCIGWNSEYLSENSKRPNCYFDWAWGIPNLCSPSRSNKTYVFNMFLFTMHMIRQNKHAVLLSILMSLKITCFRLLVNSFFDDRRNMARLLTPRKLIELHDIKRNPQKHQGYSNDTNNTLRFPWGLNRIQGTP